MTLNLSAGGLAEGVARRDAALGLLAIHREAVVRRAQRVLLRLLLDEPGRTVSIDDVRHLVTVPEGINAVCLGAAPAVLARLGIIGRVGFRQTTRPTAHARPVSVWELVNRAAALAWLAGHPELPDDEPPAATVQQPLFPVLPLNDTGAAAATAAPVLEA